MRVRTGSRYIDVELVPANQVGDSAHRQHLGAVDNWLRARIAAHNSDLGRTGDVCPYVAGALTNGTVHYALVAGDDLTALNVTAVVGSLGISFDQVRTQSRRPELETVIILFPEMAVDILEPIIFDVHHTLKDSFVRAQRMLGEFLPDYDAPGIHNPRFRPLTAPVPLLVIRSMVSNDAIFLGDSCDWLRAHARLRLTSRST